MVMRSILGMTLLVVGVFLMLLPTLFKGVRDDGPFPVWVGLVLLIWGAVIAYKASGQTQKYRQPKEQAEGPKD